MPATAEFDSAVLGGALPPAAEQALREAAALRVEPAMQGAALMRAQALAPEHPAVLIALYRSHFYAQRLQPARAVARRALVVGAAALGLPAVWREVPATPLPGARFDAGTRFYLFALKGLAYLSLRLGDAAEARDALALLRALDPDDRVGGALVEGVRLRALAHGDGDGDLDDTAAVTLHNGPQAWARLGPAPALARPNVEAAA
jgi:hypothetical protein